MFSRKKRETNERKGEKNWDGSEREVNKRANLLDVHERYKALDEKE